MQTRIIEVTSPAGNYGKFLLGRMDSEWSRKSLIERPIPGQVLLRSLGWEPEHLWVMDLQTGEGALFRPPGLATADLASRNAIYVEYDEYGHPYPIGGPGLSRIIPSANSRRHGLEQKHDQPHANQVGHQDDSAARNSRGTQGEALSGVRRDQPSEVLLQSPPGLQLMPGMPEQEIRSEVLGEPESSGGVGGRQMHELRLQQINIGAALSPSRPEGERPGMEEPQGEVAESHQEGAREVRPSLRQLPRRDAQWLGLGIWICPLFEPFLTWLYQQDLSDLEQLPDTVEIDAPFSMQGYRRSGEQR